MSIETTTTTPVVEAEVVEAEVIETTPATTTLMSSVESIIRNTIAAAKAGHVTNHVKDDAHESWDIDVGDVKYRVENINRESKTHREFNKTVFAKVAADGSTTNVNLGEWKKKLFYTLLYTLQAGKVFTKIKQDPAKIKVVAQAMKAQPEAWTMTAESIKGTIDGKAIEVKRDRVTYGSGKSLYRVKMTEDGVEVLKGSQLMKLWK